MYGRNNEMKIGVRKPSIKRSIKARTTGRMKRVLRSSIDPTYGKKGMGWIKNPKKAAYNSIYRKTTVSVKDLAIPKTVPHVNTTTAVSGSKPQISQITAPKPVPSEKTRKMWTSPWMMGVSIFDIVAGLLLTVVLPPLGIIIAAIGAYSLYMHLKHKKEMNR
jgi:hypothetical protein